jgi:prophage DNA circulation protein
MNRTNTIRQKSKNRTKKNVPDLFTLVAGNLLRVMGINVNQTVNELNIILSNKQSVEQLKKNIAELVDITNPLIDETINKIIQKWNEGIKKMGQNLSMSVVEFIPVLGQIIAEINSIQLIISNFLGIFKSTGYIVNTTLNNASRKYYRRLAAAQNVVTAPIRLAQNAVAEKIQSTENAIAENLQLAQNTVAAPIKSAQNAVAENLESVLNIPPEEKPVLGKGNIIGGAKILSRIQKSVKQFMGKNNEFINKKFINKKIIDKNPEKTSKNTTMKGGYNKNENNIISQKGGQILSRIHKSLETFNNITH